MIDESLLLQLKTIGMSEYEAKVYVILSALRVASAREIHEQTKIPRGRIYETLTTLAEKGFIVSSGRSPARYSPVDVAQTFKRLKRESLSSLEGLYQSLKDLETGSPQPLMQGYKLYTDWTCDNQIRMMLRRAKSEIILICTDGESLRKYGPDIARAAKRLYMYLVIGDPGLAGSAPVTCYTGGNDITSSFFTHHAEEQTGLLLRMLLLADRRESLTILEDNGQISGIFIVPDLFAGYLSRKILQEIEPVDRSRTGS